MQTKQNKVKCSVNQIHPVLSKPVQLGCRNAQRRAHPGEPSVHPLPHPPLSSSLCTWGVAQAVALVAGGRWLLCRPLCTGAEPCPGDAGTKETVALLPRGPEKHTYLMVMSALKERRNVPYKGGWAGQGLFPSDGQGRGLGEVMSEQQPKR